MIKINKKKVAAITASILVIISIIVVVCISNSKTEKKNIMVKAESNKAESKKDNTIEEKKDNTSDQKEVKETETVVEVDKSLSSISTENNNEEKVINSDNKTGLSEEQLEPIPTTYRNEKIGIELEFPKSWENKYEVNESEKGISVNYIFQHNYFYDYNGNKIYRNENKTRYLFSIEDVALLDQNRINVIDGIKDVPKYKTIHGKKYVIGGPTDCLDSSDPDRQEVEQFIKDLPNIINNMKEI